jgi:Ribosomal RNA methyltransferase (FmrO)
MVEDTPSATYRVRLHRLANAAAPDISALYRLDLEAAFRRLFETWSRNKVLIEALAREPDDQKLRRMRAYKDALNAARREIYFDLRRYKPDDSALLVATRELTDMPVRACPERVATLAEAIVASHASTAERLGHLEAFISALTGSIGAARSLVDVGGGMLPLLFPFARAPRLRRYSLLDRDPAAVRAVTAYAAWRGDNVLAARTWEIRDGWTAAVGSEWSTKFDVALMLKLVPVIARQSPELLPILASVPAHRLVVSGSRQALAKRRSIEARELSVLRDFARKYAFREIGHFDTEDEIALVLEAR